LKKQPTEESILAMLYHEKQRKRTKGLELACDNSSKKIVDYIILLTKLDESIKVRMKATEVLGILLELAHTDSKRILKAIKSTLVNDPNHVVKALAKEIIDNQ